MAEILSLSSELLGYRQTRLGVEAFVRAANHLFASELGRAATEAVRGSPTNQTRRESLRRHAFTRLSRECARTATQVEDWVLYALIEIALENQLAHENPRISALDSFYL
jgi:hypothetical protein